jgi:hypothetical protein
MSEQTLNSTQEYDTITHSDVRAELERIERQLIPLLVSIQRILGKEPSVVTREERRKRSSN